MDVCEIISKQREFFNSGRTRELDFRLNALKSLSAAISGNENEILRALREDLNKSDVEGYMTEISIVQEELAYIVKHLPKWVRDRRVKTAMLQFPAKCYVSAEPYGVALIMSPWNYPFQLAVAPLIGAVAAGNCAVIKPSAYSPHTSAVIAKLISEVFAPEHCVVFEGGRAENSELLKQKFDYIFFTGSVAVGKLVMEAAAKHLTPVSLELGGKSPVIVDETADIGLAAKRLVFGKYINAGQTCVAPDYVLVHKSKKDELVRQLGYWIEQFYPKGDSQEIADYPRIINEKHFDRLLGLMDGENIIIGGGSRRESLSIDPTVLIDVDFDRPVMQEEIFGPLLPVLTYRDLNEAIEAVRSRPKPLALYLFSSNKAVQRRVLRELSFGGGCINDVILHLATPHMPFGGVGESGMGGYHGKASFDTFTHYKSIVDKAQWPDFSMRYRPYTGKKARLLRRLMK